MDVNSLDTYLRPHFADASNVTPYDDAFLQDFLKQGPLHAFIPTELGGAETSARTAMEVLETTSYHSFPLGLTLGISGSLFVRPMVRLAAPALRDRVLSGFLKGSEMGGIMITEPEGGTDIFGLQAGVSVSEGTLTLNGRKCWGGLTGRAEHWLVAAREKKGDRLTRRIAMVYVPFATPGINVETRFNALGLQPIPYGLTSYNQVQVPEEHLVVAPDRNALRHLYDILFRSRMVISSIAAGHCRRLADETAHRARTRIAGGRPIAEHDQVAYRLEQIQGIEQINRSLWQTGAEWMTEHQDMSSDYLLVNAAKVVATDALAFASDAAFHVFASAAFKKTHLVGRGYVDVRPFRIFEGVNDVLYANTYEILAKQYGEVTPDSLAEALAHYGFKLPANLSAGVFECLVPDSPPSQRQRVLLGELISWITALAVLEYRVAKEGDGREEGARYLRRHIAAKTAEAPYL